MLKWEKQKGLGEAWFGYSGHMRVAMVVLTNAGHYRYSLDAVHTKFITKGHGDVKTLDQGRKSVERAWATWLDAASLQQKI
jgi:hypothetical protein